MSKKNLNESTIQVTMGAVKNYTEPSKCITIFESLLSEVAEMDESIIGVVIADLNRFIEGAIITFNESERIRYGWLKSKMISKDFIRPESYFIRTERELRKVYDPGKETKHLVFNLDQVRSGVDSELARKTLLIWNYIPAICKAIIMTRRRKLGLDKNSKKF